LGFIVYQVTLTVAALGVGIYVIARSEGSGERNINPIRISLSRPTVLIENLIGAFIADYNRYVTQ